MSTPATTQGTEQLPAIDPRVTIGHTHLKVADLQRAIDFYTQVLGLEVMQQHGDDVAFLSAGGYHHHIALNTWLSKGGPRPPEHSTGLFHVALLYPDRASLATAVRRVMLAGVPLEGASDHGVSEAVYLSDPDGNGIELYRDRPRSDWPRTQAGALAMYTRPLDIEELTALSGQTLSN